ncbi:MAG: glycosyltransferase family 39 protein [Sedimentisphaerales bacterium]|nr:glycosyltransferase family 39 protein [Sedimentisphaerales bacterium]
MALFAEKPCILAAEVYTVGEDDRAFKSKKAGEVMRFNKAAIIPAAVIVVCLVPFVNKAFHIDDTLFIRAAEQIQIEPTDFYGFSINWYGWEMPMAEVTKNPPIASYYIAFSAAMFGWSEIALHIAFLVPAAAMAAGSFFLAQKLCSRPVPAALAAMLTPGILVSSTNVMCDTMMLAFWVWAIVLWLRGMETNKNWDLFFAGVLIAVCALTKYFGIALLPLLFVYSIVKRRKGGVWILFLLIPAVILGSYQWMTYKLYGISLLSDAASYAGGATGHAADLLSSGLICLFFVGGCMATVLFYSPLLWSRRVLAGEIILVILFIVLLSLSGISRDNSGQIRWSFVVQASLMAVTGISIFVLGGADFLKNKNAESLLLLLWIVGPFIFTGFVNWTINARSIIPMAPAVGILLVRRMEKFNYKTWKIYWPLVPAAVLSLMLCWADYTWAGTGRSAAEAVGENFGSSPNTIWFQGHWGFQYYMEAVGAKAIDLRDQKVDHADIIVIPSNNPGVRNLPQEVMYLNKVFQFNLCRGLTTMDMQSGAGFYSDGWGPLPFFIGPIGPAEYSVFIIK